MASARARSRRTLERFVLAGAAGNRAAARQRERWSAFVGGVLSGALTVPELQSLTVRLYEADPARYSREGLETWEAAQYEALPAPPADVLVTAAGAGREVRELLARGYRIDAIEPVADLAAACAASPGVRTAVTASHDDLVAAVMGRGGPAVQIAERRYGAVLIGWGSFTHVLSREGQLALLSACDRLAPEGPILVSYFTVRIAARPPRAQRVGRRVGRLFASHGTPTADDFPVGFAWHLGFTHPCRADEIEGLADAVGRRAETRTVPYGHATLWRLDHGTTGD